MAAEISLKGWIETDGIVLTPEEIAGRLSHGTEWLTSCGGGEFFLAWEGGCARDQMGGIVPGRCDAGVVMEKGVVTGYVKPDPPLFCRLQMQLRLQYNSEMLKGVVSFSGGVDSALIAAVAGLPCVSVGTEGSHDLCHATEVAGEIGLDLICVTVTPDEIEDALKAVMQVIPPRVTPRSMHRLRQPSILSHDGQASMDIPVFLQAREQTNSLEDMHGIVILQISSVSSRRTLRALPCRVHATRRWQTFLDACFPVRFSMYVLCALQKQFLRMKRYSGGEYGNIPSERSHAGICRGKPPVMIRRRCSMAAVSGRSSSGPHAKTVIKTQYKGT